MSATADYLSSDDVLKFIKAKLNFKIFANFKKVNNLTSFKLGIKKKRNI